MVTGIFSPGMNSYFRHYQNFPRTAISPFVTLPECRYCHIRSLFRNASATLRHCACISLRDFFPFDVRLPPLRDDDA